MGEKKTEKFHGQRSSLHRPKWEKPWAWMKRMLARYRAWLKFLRDNDDIGQVDQVAAIALDTDHWPDDFRICPICGGLMGKTELLCDICKGEQEDHRDEVRQAHTVGYPV